MVAKDNPIIAQYLAAVAKAKRNAEEKREQEESIEEAFKNTVTVVDSASSRPVYGIVQINGKLDLRLPPPPRRPSPEDCCQNGCVPCIMDTYQEALQAYDAKVERLKQEFARMKKEGPQAHTPSQGTIDQLALQLQDSEDEATNAGTDYHCCWCSASDGGGPCVCGDASGRRRPMPIDPLQFRSVPIHAVHNPSPLTLVFELDWIDDAESLKCGEHVHVRIPIHSDKGQTYITRPFTPVFVPCVPNGRRACLYIRLYDHRPMSTHFKAMAEGDKLLIRGPLKTDFDVQKVISANTLLLFAAGSGIAPIYQILEETSRRADTNNDSKRPRVLLIYACQTVDQVWLEDRLVHLLSMCPGSQFHLFVSQGSEAQIPLGSRIGENAVSTTFARLTSDALETIAGDFVAKSGCPNFENSEIHSVICGPEAFNNDVKSTLLKHLHSSQVTTLK